MATLDLTEEELMLVRSALESYLEQFGHEEQDTVKLIQRVYKKVGGDLSRMLGG
jgi:hypothetical protein